MSSWFAPPPSEHFPHVDSMRDGICEELDGEPCLGILAGPEGLAPWAHSGHETLKEVVREVLLRDLKPPEALKHAGGVFLLQFRTRHICRFSCCFPAGRGDSSSSYIAKIFQK